MYTYKRVFLILTSFLIIGSCSSCSLSNEEESNYMEGEIEEVEVVDDGSRLSRDGSSRIFTDEDFDWNGEVVDGYAEGEGVISWPNSQRVYEGTVNQGHITGRGALYMDGEVVYVGDFEDGKAEGEGCFYYDKTLLYAGGVKNNKYHGQGKKYYSDGASLAYSGEFEDGMYHGYGISYYPDGSRCYEGEFVNGSFRWLQESTTTAENIGHKIVQEVFNGGSNEVVSLVSSKIGMNSNNHEIVFNLSFDGDIISSNHYECKVRVINSGSETRYDLIEKNEQVQNYLDIKGMVIAGAALASYFSEFDD